MTEAKILIDRDDQSPDGYKFSFTTNNGKLAGHVAVPLGSNRPDKRTPEEKVEQVKKKIVSLAAEFLKAAQG